MSTDLKKWVRFSAILEDPGMSSSRKVTIGDVMDRQDNDRWKSWLGAKKIAKVGKRSQKGGSWNLALELFFLTLCSPSSLYIHRWVGSCQRPLIMLEPQTVIRKTGSWAEPGKKPKNRFFSREPEAVFLFLMCLVRFTQLDSNFVFVFDLLFPTMYI